MKKLNINQLLLKASLTRKRFPLTLLSAFLALLISLFFIEFEKTIENEGPYINSILIAIIGIPIFLNIELYSEIKKRTLASKTLYVTIAFVILFLIFTSLPETRQEAKNIGPYIRYILFNLIAHLTVSFIPFLKTKTHIGFWNYNKTLFIRLLTSLFYSSILNIGLCLALFAITSLFGIGINEKRYTEILISIWFLFNTWYFLAGIPKNFNKLELLKQYPKGLRIFSLYILLPLLILYLGILYLYGIKITSTWNWPKGLVSYLILLVSFLGIFTLLLLYPFSQLFPNSWIKKFQRQYYILLIPLLILLYIAIITRVLDYGFTIKRYLVVAFGIWLSILSIYFAVGKKNIKLIPISLAVLFLLICLGPINMFKVCRDNQINRLIVLFEENDLIKEGKIIELSAHNSSKIQKSDWKQIKSILDYLNKFHGLKQLHPLLSNETKENIQQKILKNEYRNEAKIYIEAIGFDYYDYALTKAKNIKTYTYSRDRKNPIRIKNHDYLIDFIHYNSNINNSIVEFNLKKKDYELNYVEAKNMYQITVNQDNIFIKLNPKLNSLYIKYGREKNYFSDVNENIMTFESTNRSYKIVFDELSIVVDGKIKKVKNAKGKILIKLEQ